MTLRIFGCLMSGAGTVFALQGAGVLGGSAMSNDPTWIWLGALIAAGGLVLVYRSFRAR